MTSPTTPHPHDKWMAMVICRFTVLPFAIFLVCLLSACAKTTSPTPLPTVSVATSAPGETRVIPTPAPTGAVTPPTPTNIATEAPPLKIGYLDDTPNTESQPTFLAVQRAAQEFGWAAEVGPRNSSVEISLRDLANGGAQIMVVYGETLPVEMSQAVHAVASEFPSVTFVSVNLLFQAEPPANVSAVGGAGSRYDQLGFLAGMAAGLATETKTVAAVTDLSVEGLNYRNGFLHGVRYTCPRCQLQYIDVFDIENGGVEAAQTAALYASISSDVVFAAAGNAGNEALKAAAQAGAWVIGTSSDVYITVFENGVVPGADKTLTSVYFEAGAAVYQALVQYHAGASLSGAHPFSAATQAIALASYRGDALNMLDQQEIAAALARLADGTLDTGIDPLTGQEK